MYRCPTCDGDFESLERFLKHLEAFLVYRIGDKAFVVEERRVGKKKLFSCSCGKRSLPVASRPDHLKAHGILPIHLLKPKDIPAVVPQWFSADSELTISDDIPLRGDNPSVGPSKPMLAIPYQDEMNIDGEHLAYEFKEDGMEVDGEHLVGKFKEELPGGPPDYPSSESYQGLGGERSDDDGNPTADRQTPVDDEDPAHSLQADDWHGVDDAMNECQTADHSEQVPISQRTMRTILNKAADSEVSPPLKAFLWSLGLVINQEIHVLICFTCKEGVNPTIKSIVNHLNDHHAGKGKTMHTLRPGLVQELEINLRGYPFALPSKVRVQDAMRTCIPWLRVHRGLWCTHTENGLRCDSTLLEKSSMKQHIKSHERKPVRPAEACYCQTIFIGNLMRYFPVSESELRDTTLVHRLLVKAEKEASRARESVPKHIEPYREGELPSLVRQAKWHFWVKEYRGDPVEVTGLIEFPGGEGAGISDTEQLLLKLPRVSEEWMDRACCFWNGATGTMYRYLKGMPVTDKWWDWVERLRTHRDYGRTLTKFAAAAIRSLSRLGNDRFKLPLNEVLLSAVDDLKLALQKLPWDSTTDELTDLPTGSEPKELPTDEMVAVSALQRFFFTAMTGTIDGSTMDRFKCPALTYIACFAYNPDDTFKGASEVTSLLANWKFLLRSTALFEARTKHSDDNKAGEFLRKHCERHISKEAVYSVFDSVSQLQALASTIALNQPISVNVCWNQDMTIMQHQKYQVVISNLTEGVQKMFDDLLENMYALSGGEPVEFTVPKNHVDDLASTVRGESWLAGCHTTPPDHALMESMARKDLWSMSCAVDGKLLWNEIACLDFMRKAAEIVDLIITLVHLGAGPPLRGEELVLDQIENGVRPRSIYLIFGQMLAIRRRSKDTHARGVDSFNPCYFPKKLTDAICYYLVVIRPLEKLVAEKLYPKRKDPLVYNLFLYVKEGKRMTSEDFSSVLSRLTSKYIGVGLSLQPARHVMVAFHRAFVEETNVQKGNNVGDLISSHSSKTARDHYAREFDIEGLTSTLLLDVQDWCDLYHDAIGLGKRTTPLISIRTKRRVGQLLLTAAALNPEHPTTTRAVHEILMTLGEAAYTAGLQELKTHATKEIYAATSKAFEKVIADYAVFRDTLTAMSGPTQAKVQPNQHLPPQPDIQSHPQQAQTGQTSIEAQAGPGRSKRSHSNGGAQPEAKRRDLKHMEMYKDLFGVAPEHAQEPSAAIPTEFQEPAPNDIDHWELEYEDHAQDGFRTEPTAPDHPTPNPPLLSRAAQNDLQEQATIQQMSAMNLEPHDLPVQSFHRSSIDSEELLQVLRTYLGDQSAEFKSDAQEELVRSVSSGSHTLGVLPTGSGKSKAFELAAHLTKQSAIVAVPFRLIAAQVRQNTAARGLRTEQWTGDISANRLGGTAILILMAFETLTTDATISWIAKNNHQIGALVIDEAHTIVSDSGFRSGMLNFRKLINARVPITLLTGTLPPTFSETLIFNCGLENARYNTIRVPTNRTEHRYGIVLRDKAVVHSTAESFVRRATGELKGTQRGIILTRTRDAATHLASLLDVGFIIADGGSDDARNDTMQNWREGGCGGWIVGTKSLLQGLDYPDVRFVLFVESPFGMLDFVQGAGRGGRNGEMCRVVLFHSDVMTPKDPDIGCLVAMNTWANNTELCRREGISECMDGRTVTCNTLEGAVKCDICLSNEGKSAGFEELSCPYTGPGGNLVNDRLFPLEELVPTHPNALDMPMVVPQAPRSTVLLASDREEALQGDRVDAMKRCIQTLELYHAKINKGRTVKERKCIACVHLNLTTHWMMCLKQKEAGALAHFYNFNKPSVGRWSYDRAAGGPWCSSCSLPCGVLKDTGKNHEFVKGCPWNETMLNAGWIVAHDERLFARMKAELQCSLDSHLTEASTTADRLKLSIWLADKSPDEKAYNIHAVWLWYYNMKFGQQILPFKPL